MTFIAWLLGNKFGRWVAWGALGLAFIGVLFLMGVRQGKDQEKAKLLAQSLKNAMDRIKSNAEVTQMSARARRDALNSWMRE